MNTSHWRHFLRFPASRRGPFPSIALRWRRQPLVLLSGALCDAALWRHQIAGLSDIADIRVGDLTRDDSVGSMAARVLASQPKHFALAGISLGGYVALEIMRRAPERVTRLALLDTTARPEEQSEGTAEEPPGIEPAGRQGGPAALGQVGLFTTLLVHPSGSPTAGSRPFSAPWPNG